MPKTLYYELHDEFKIASRQINKFKVITSDIVFWGLIVKDFTPAFYKPFNLIFLTLINLIDKID
ncbi:MAG: hypothetical protein H6743_04500 [Rickettsiaceae bacterium]|nr:hypothetical protein [Rickettsiaceae bacterium]